MDLARPAAPTDRPDLARALLLAVVAIGALRVAALLVNRTDLYFDEAQYWTWSQALDWGYYSKPPLIALLIRITTNLFGDAEWAVRLSSPILHTLTALTLHHLGSRLHGPLVGAWSALTFATLPAVSLSATLVSTDVPLLLFWATGLVAAVRLIDRGDGWAAAGLAGSVALGLNAKYPMLLLPALVGAFLLLTPALRGRLRSPVVWAGLVGGLLGLVPNAIWQAQNDFVTLMHTRDNAKWTGALFHPGAALEFFGAQFGVFGPILFAGLIAATAGLWRTDRPLADRFLIATSVPIVLAFTAQGLISRANANWAATAYPGATVLVVALLASRPRLFRASLGLHGVVAALLLVGPAFAPELRLPGGARPFERVLGWRDFALAAERAARETGARTLILDRRSDVAAALYYLRDSDLAIAVERDWSRPPLDHYEMTRPFSTDLPAPGLLVTAPGRTVALEGARPAGEPVTLQVSRGVAKGLALTGTPLAW
ncbi:ArnT family glycosyltransferase [Chthonobacter rhizosphaerae]|uniref:ArnT family glycosyltransferase n=1 Tax=Chthonobacter rhizosphaerae TaxID=2735553 RepID=UPI0015EF5BDA|nr:glycosyltransferase family 39 protein [Chthonobacter rhizosphaerae]